ncbi:hypothetical protein DC522_32110 [Microvirga sp. KLBC 81]|uniref:hypothetical protein n=1 Tax=Microvirga sp. KLBC 81 TaxID=1862707 RepID=UPI000D51E8B1|nr:hypothetical protein [Microvirga sp. KLBC 81]PVE20469.1 hypothetical protein DC522_32110 [Microvirga sp. KLBC 81]
MKTISVDKQIMLLSAIMQIFQMERRTVADMWGGMKAFMVHFRVLPKQEEINTSDAPKVNVDAITLRRMVRKVGKRRYRDLSDMRLKLAEVLHDNGIIPHETTVYADLIACHIIENKIEVITEGEMTELVLSSTGKAEDFEMAMAWAKFALFDFGIIVDLGIEGGPSHTKYRKVH